MKFRYLLALILGINLCLFAKGFIRNLPSQQLIKQLTPENFPSMDAVIILKDQSYKISTTSINYRGLSISGPSITKTTIIIVKTFNEAGVNRYANFEYEYAEPFGDEIPCGFFIQARILKLSGKINKISNKNVQKIVSLKSYDGDPIMRKVLFKLHDVNPGDIIQIEYCHTEPLSSSSSGLFYYHDQDFVLVSNIYITLPFKATANYYSFPQNIIGEPQIIDVSKTYGSGKTYFWSLSNLNPIPNEPYSFPFASQSYLTAFVVDKWSINSPVIGNWNDIAKIYYKNHLQGKKISDKYLDKMNLPTDSDLINKSFGIVDTLYHTLRNSIQLKTFNSIYPIDEISDVFENGCGDASDLAFIMYKILEKWEFTPKIVWIRDKREGLFEQTVPTTRWFDRIGVQVSINNKKQLYDFDPCIPNWYLSPWFDKNIDIVVIDKNSSAIEFIKSGQSYRENIIREENYFNFPQSGNDVKQNSILSMTGGFADNFRGEYFNSDSFDTHSKLKAMIKNTLSDYDTISWNDFYNCHDVLIKYQGISANKIQDMQQFKIFKCNNILLDNFRNTLYSYNRRTMVNLEFPNRIESIWHFTAPEHFKFDSLKITKKHIIGPNRCSASINVKHHDSQLDYTVIVNFPEYIIPLKNYPRLIQFLDEIILLANRNIVLIPQKI